MWGAGNTDPLIEYNAVDKSRCWAVDACFRPGQRLPSGPCDDTCRARTFFSVDFPCDQSLQGVSDNSLMAGLILCSAELFVSLLTKLAVRASVDPFVVFVFRSVYDLAYSGLRVFFIRNAMNTTLELDKPVCGGTPDCAIRDDYTTAALVAAIVLWVGIGVDRIINTMGLYWQVHAVVESRQIRLSDSEFKNHNSLEDANPWLSKLQILYGLVRTFAEVGPAAFVSAGAGACMVFSQKAGSNAAAGASLGILVAESCAAAALVAVVIKHCAQEEGIVDKVATVLAKGFFGLRMLFVALAAVGSIVGMANGLASIGDAWMLVGLPAVAPAVCDMLWSFVLWVCSGVRGRRQSGVSVHEPVDNLGEEAPPPF